MAYNATGGMPPQQLPFSKKTNKWRKLCVDVGDDHSLLNNNLSRKTFHQMVVNYDLLNGKLHMDELKKVVNPYDLEASFIPEDIQHYSIINSKLNVLRGEESERPFDFRAIVTNPNAISEMEEEKNKVVNAKVLELISDVSQSEEDFQKELQRLSDYFKFKYQDKREIRANRVINHYRREQEFDQKWNKGLVDAQAVAEEMYQFDIEGGEPIMRKLGPTHVRILRGGNEHEIEKADMIILEEYRNLGWVIDTYWDQLTPKDIKELESGVDQRGNGYPTDSMDNIDPRYGFIFAPDLPDHVAGDSIIHPDELFDSSISTNLTPYDINGNVRVLRVYWKSRRKIKKVKSYDPETGEEEFNFYPETYHCDPEKGEEEESFWINEAWEGTKIGTNIYVNMRPRPVQYNSLSNPSKCHFGIIGSIYSINDDRPFSMVDMVKPYAYLYDVMHDRLNKTLAKNVGKVIRLDFAKVPKDWSVDQWLYYIMVNGVAVEDSFKEGTQGAATGRLAASMGNANNGVIDASLGNEVQSYISILEWCSTKIGEIIGISKQREGQISNRETVGGVERATLQSSHITKWLFFVHDSVKKRCLECFLDTAKIAFKGRKVKFSNLLADGSRETIEFDGDEFAECDYGILMDNSNGAIALNQKMETLAQAALQNQAISFSTVMKIFTTESLSEKQRLVEADEERILQRRQQELEQQQQTAQMQIQTNAQIEQAKMQQEYTMAQEKNETALLVAQINSVAESQRMALMNHDNEEANTFTQKELDEKKRQFDAKVKQDAAKLELDKKKHQDDVRLKEKQLSKQNSK